MIRFLLMGASLLCFVICGSSRAQSVLFTIESSPSVTSIQSVSGAGDINKDGFDDFLIGDWPANIFSGKDSSILDGIAEGADSVSNAGDVDKDGFADVICGIEAGTTWKGVARVYSGKTGGILWTFTGPVNNDGFGKCVSGAGDVNLDGHADLIVDSPYSNDGGAFAGKAEVFSGKTGAVLYTFRGEAGAACGTSVSDAGDVNQDGNPDVVIGERGHGGYSGRVRVLSGKTGGTLHTFIGAPGSALGTAVSGAGDVDNDGHPDVIAGAPWHDQAMVFSGKTGATLWSFAGPSGRAFGSSVSDAGEIDQDGFADVIVGAPVTDGSFAGSADVFAGRTGSLNYSWLGYDPRYLFGNSVSSAGDVNGDGNDDLIVGAPGSTGGYVRVFSGSGCVSGWSNYGAGWPGTQGVPSFVALNPPVICEPVGLVVANSRGAATQGFLLVGVTPASLPTPWGGTLLLLPNFTIGIAIPQNGLGLSVTMPCDSTLCGFSIYAQVIESDPGASRGFSFTQGLRLDAGGG